MLLVHNSGPDITLAAGHPAPFVPSGGTMNLDGYEKKNNSSEWDDLEKQRQLNAAVLSYYWIGAVAYDTGSLQLTAPPGTPAPLTNTADLLYVSKFVMAEEKLSILDFDPIYVSAPFAFEIVSCHVNITRGCPNGLVYLTNGASDTDDVNTIAYSDKFDASSIGNVIEKLPLLNSQRNVPQGGSLYLARTNDYIEGIFYMIWKKV